MLVCNVEKSVGRGDFCSHLKGSAIVDINILTIDNVSAECVKRIPQMMRSTSGRRR